MLSFEHLGLAKGEASVYQALLENGNSTINKIHEQTGIERRNIYDILNKLLEKGIISYTSENKRRTFQVTHPSKLISYIEEKKSTWDAVIQEVEKEMPVLLAQYHDRKAEIHAEVFRGKEGIKAVWDDMLHAKDILWIGSGRYLPKQFPVFFSHWNKKRVEKKIKMYNIYRNEMKRKITPYALEYARFLPKEFSGNPSVICIFGNKVVNFLYSEMLFAFVMESKEIAENYRSYHSYLWEHVAKE